MLVYYKWFYLAILGCYLGHNPFSDIIHVALLLWQDMERVEKANIPSDTWLILEFC